MEIRFNGTVFLSMADLQRMPNRQRDCMMPKRTLRKPKPPFLSLSGGTNPRAIPNMPDDMTLVSTLTLSKIKRFSEPQSFFSACN